MEKIAGATMTAAAAVLERHPGRGHSATQAVQHNCGLIGVMQTAAQRAGIKLDGDLLAMSSAKR
jgi:hypothetical protein